MQWTRMTKNKKGIEYEKTLIKGYYIAPSFNYE